MKGPAPGSVAYLASRLAGTSGQYMLKTRFDQGTSTDTLQLTKSRTAVIRQLVECPTVRGRAYDAEESLNPAIPLPEFLESKIVIHLADVWEVQIGLLLHEPEADVHIHPTAPDGLGQTAMAGREPTGRTAIRSFSSCRGCAMIVSAWP